MSLWFLMWSQLLILLRTLWTCWIATFTFCFAFGFCQFDYDVRCFVIQGLYPTGLFCPWNSPGKNTGVGSHSLLQGIFLISRSNSSILHCRQILYHLSCQGSPMIKWWYLLDDLAWSLWSFLDMQIIFHQT